VNTEDPHLLPPRASPRRLLTNALTQLSSILNNTTPFNPFNPTSSNSNQTTQCTQCLAALQVGKFLALAAPEQTPEFVVALCNALRLSGTCEETFGRLALGGVVTQVLAAADVGGYDGQVSWLSLPLRVAENLIALY
jgi:hypothetical protein